MSCSVPSKRKYDMSKVKTKYTIELDHDEATALHVVLAGGNYGHLGLSDNDLNNLSELRDRLPFRELEEDDDELERITNKALAKMERQKTQAVVEKAHANRYPATTKSQAEINAMGPLAQRNQRANENAKAQRQVIHAKKKRVSKKDSDDFDSLFTWAYGTFDDWFNRIF